MTVTRVVILEKHQCEKDLLVTRTRKRTKRDKQETLQASKLGTFLQERKVPNLVKLVRQSLSTG